MNAAEKAVLAFPCRDILELSDAGRAELHRLKSQLPTRRQSMAAARARLSLKIAVRNVRRAIANRY